MMFIGLRGCVGMDFRGNLSNCSSSIILRKRIKLFTSHILSHIHIRDCRRWSLRFHSIGNLLSKQDFAKV